jgi:hypothetical protein
MGEGNGENDADEGIATPRKEETKTSDIVSQASFQSINQTPPSSTTSSIAITFVPRDHPARFTRITIDAYAKRHDCHGTDRIEAMTHLEKKLVVVEFCENVLSRRGLLRL